MVEREDQGSCKPPEVLLYESKVLLQFFSSRHKQKTLACIWIYFIAALALFSSFGEINTIPR